MRNILNGYLSTYIDNAQGHFTTCANVTIKPETITDPKLMAEMKYVFPKFALGSKFVAVFEISDTDMSPISALSYGKTEELNSGLCKLQLFMHIFTSGILTRASLYYNSYYVLHESNKFTPVIVRRRNDCKDEILDTHVPKIIDKCEQEPTMNNDYTRCGNLFIKGKSSIELQLSYAVNPAMNCRHDAPESAILAAYVAIKSLVS